MTTGAANLGFRAFCDVPLVERAGQVSGSLGGGGLMDFDALWAVADRARTRYRLPPEDVSFVRDEVPTDLASFPRVPLPKAFLHPGGFSVSGAPVGTVLRSALLVAGQKALGGRFGGSPFFEAVERDLAFGIMRSHFHHGYPKGTHCCVRCTLAVYPVLEAGAIRCFDCGQLARELKRLITEGGWRFASPPDARMLRWALGTEPR
jgi:hypothetical protein